MLIEVLGSDHGFANVIVGILRGADQFVVAAELDRTGIFEAKRGRCPLELDSTPIYLPGITVSTST